MVDDVVEVVNFQGLNSPGDRSELPRPGTTSDTQLGLVESSMLIGVTLVEDCSSCHCFSPRPCAPTTLLAALVDRWTEAYLLEPRGARHGGYIAADNTARVGLEYMLGAWWGVVYLLLVPPTDADAR